MKQLNEIKNEIAELKEIMLCQENGNDFYFSSPLYHKHLFELQALEAEEQVLTGKASPNPIEFNENNKIKNDLLKQLARDKGVWYAEFYKNLKLDDLIDMNKNN